MMGSCPGKTRPREGTVSSPGLKWSLVLVMGMAMGSCSPVLGQQLLRAESPLLLEDHLDAATIVGSDVPADLPEVIAWDFAREQPTWTPIAPLQAESRAVVAERVQDALRLRVTAENMVPGFGQLGVVQTELGDLDMEEWDYVEVRVRTVAQGGQVGLLFNLTDQNPVVPVIPFANIGAVEAVRGADTIQTYQLRLGGSFARAWEGTWTHLGVGFVGRRGSEAVFDVLSIRVVPKAVGYAGAGAGVRGDRREIRFGRRALYTHTPARVEYDVVVPAEGRFVTGLGVIRSDVPVDFSITVRTENGGSVTVLEETVADPSDLAQRTIDLSEFSGQTVTLVLTTNSPARGTVALWGAPTLSDAFHTHDTRGGLIDEAVHRVVTSGSGVADWTVAFSPDGTDLLFSRTDRRSGRSELKLVPAAGGDARPFTGSDLPVSASRMAWSETTGRVAFTGFDEDGATIWLVNPDGTGPEPVTAEGLSSEVFYPSWYPDGRSLAVVDYGGGPGGVIKRIDLDLGTVEALTSREDVLAGKPAVSPDGRAIAFAGRPNDGLSSQAENRIWMLEDGALRELDPEQGRAPAWSPDGEWIVFESDRGSPNGHYALFIVPRAGGQALQLTSFDVHANHPAWSPDGSEVAFSVAADLQSLWRIALVPVPRR